MVERPSEIQYSDKGSGKKTPLVLSLIVAVAAAGVSVWGINSTGLTAGLPSAGNSQSSAAGSQQATHTVEPPSSKEEQAKLLAAGEKVHQERCAGCHASDTKLIGPSYSEICRKYGESVEITGSPTLGVTDQVDATALSAIGFATTHPKNAWDGYQRGPQINLSDDERRAIAYWIFNISKDEEDGDD